MAAQMDIQPSYHPESPMDPDDVPYPCKGCGEILEEGKAFELANHRWHIDCFRCNSCSTLLDSDANLLLLGDGSLICNNCTYSCSACGNKIEDLAILTGDHAYCASCFRCRNCKNKIENLRYARTNQGMFCMECHDTLMAKRRKKTSKNQQKSNKGASGAMLLDKSLPSLPPNIASKGPRSPQSESYPDSAPAELPASSPGEQPSSNLNLSSNAYRNRGAAHSHRQELEDTDHGFYIPMTLDPNPAPGPAPGSEQMPQELPAMEPPKPRRAETDGDYLSSRQRNQRWGLDPENRSNSTSRVPSAGQSRSRSPVVPEAELEADTGDRRRVISSSSKIDEGTPRSSKTDLDSKFQLQEAPRQKKSISNKRNSKGDTMPSALDTSAPDRSSKSAPVSAHTPLREQHVNIGAESPRTSLGAPYTASPRLSQSTRGDENNISESSRTATPEPHILPKRGDSLQKGIPTGTVSRKELSGHMKSTSMALRDEPTSPGSKRASLDTQTVMNGGKVISRPMESPVSKSSMDFPSRSKDRPGAVGDNFNSPRVPPQIPEGQTPQDRGAQPQPTSPTLPRHESGMDLMTTEDMDRIMGVDDNSLFKRVSNSVRHARSQSDRGSRGSKDQKWPKTPLNGTSEGALAEDLGSPLLSSPEGREDPRWYRSQLKKEREKIAAMEKRMAELEATLESKSTIKQMSKELREKRSTIVVLDAQKEIVFRELETLREHISSAKESKEPFDLTNISNGIIRDFAASLERLKDNFTPQIEELMEKKVSLAEEVAKLNLQRDRVMQEFEQLSMKNAQLAELNNNLVHQLQKAGALPEGSQGRVQGLGIYTQNQKDKSNVSVDSREVRSSLASQMTGSTLHENEQDASGAMIVNAPRVVNIRKEQASKKTFNWKKGSNVAKGVTKGIKGAFSSNEPRPRDVSTPTGLIESTPYSSTQNGEPPSTSLPRAHTVDANRQGFGFFGQPKRPVANVRTLNGVFSPEEIQHPSRLFGAELEARADYERTSIPSIVTRCIEEVELRGMNDEGIYRKSGGANQIQVIRDGFIQSNDFDISDPDIDINAVTSALKQYFRKLPTPLITYAVYDQLIDSTSHNDDQERIKLMRNAIAHLPLRHKECLEFLIFHLARVVEKEKENLMTSLNCAVVFAPTIMRPESISREMTDTPAKNNAVQFLIDHCHSVFMSGNS